MRDWEKVVGDRVAQLVLGERERQEVFAELAGHLEKTCETLRQGGASQDEAIRGALLQVDDWSRLQQDIWIPSLVTLVVWFITLVAFGFLGRPPGPLGSRPHHEEWSSHLISGITRGPHVVNEYTVWLMVCPLLGRSARAFRVAQAEHSATFSFPGFFRRRLG
jgi:hypothetical protein